MRYVNFADANGNILVDIKDREFLVRDENKVIIRNYTFEDIRNIIENETLKTKFYLYSLYDDETVREDLSQYVLDGGSLTINYNCGIRRKLSINLYNNSNWIPSPIKGFLWKGSKFKLEIGLSTAFAEYICPAGVFILQDFEMPHKYIKNEISLEMVDKFGGLDGTVGGKISSSTYIPRGSNIVKVINSLLKSEKIELAQFDTKTPLFHDWMYLKQTPYSITESLSSIGELIIKLAQIINLDVFYDEYGRMCFEEMRENLLLDSQPSLWVFSNSENLYDYHSTSVNLQAVENIIEVEGANIDGNIVNVRVENTNPKSPTNITLFEPTIFKITDENISNESRARLRAEYELFKRSLIPLSINFSSILNPKLNVNKVITIDDDYCGLKCVRFLINSINIPVSEFPKMSMTINNLEEAAFSV